jgi:sugar lactone lactonase YvrE
MKKQVPAIILALIISGCSTLLSETSPSVAITSLSSTETKALDQEYYSFKTEDLKKSYLGRKLNKWLSLPAYGAKLYKEIEYTRTKNPGLMFDIIADEPGLLGLINIVPEIASAKIYNVPFKLFMDSLTPAPELVSGQVITIAGFGNRYYYADGVASNASFSDSGSLITDSSGNIFVADKYNSMVRKIDSAGNVTTFAGGTQPGCFEEGTGTLARFCVTSDITRDIAGNFYVTDTINNRIRKITSGGVVTTLAGNGDQGDQDGTSATFSNPQGIVYNSGNLYVTDVGNSKIRKIVIATGEVSTFAGGNGSSDFSSPAFITVDNNNVLYVTDIGNCLISKIVISTGEVTAIAGNPDCYVADGTGSEASFGRPAGLVPDNAGNLFVVDNYANQIRKVVIDTGEVSTVVGNDNIGNVNGNGTEASFSYPSGITRDSLGNLFVFDGNFRIRKIDTDYNVTNYAGNGSPMSLDGIGTMARFYGPTSIIADNQGNLYFTDSSGNRIRKVVLATAQVTTIAGHGNQPIGFGYGDFADGQGSEASFFNPQGIALYGGNMYVADTNNSRIRKIDSTGYVSTIAGNESTGSLDGTRLDASFKYPEGIAADNAGILYIADRGNQLIRKMVLSSGDVSTIAGNSTVNGGNGAFADGTGTDANFYYPNSVVLDNTGNLYVSDSGNNRIRKVVIATGQVTTIAGNDNLNGSYADGNGTEASLNYPKGISRDSDGNLYVADANNNRIRKIAPNGDVTTIAGNGIISYGDFTDGIGTNAAFAYPVGITIDNQGDIYVTDSNNSKIRKIIK